MDNLDIIYGKNTVLELVKTGKRSVNKILISKGLNKDGKIDEIIAYAKNRGVVFQFIPRENFAK